MEPVPGITQGLQSTGCICTGLADHESLSKPAAQALNGTVSLSEGDSVTFQESKVGHGCHYKV